VLYARKRMDLVGVANELGISYEDVKRWYNNAWERDRDEHLPFLVKRLMKKRYGLRRGETGPSPASATFGSMIDVLANEFDEERRDMKELVLDLIQAHKEAEEALRLRKEQQQRESDEHATRRVEKAERREEIKAWKTEAAEEARQSAIRRVTRECKSCGNSFIGRTKKCIRCGTPLCPNCAKDFCGVCYSSQSIK